MRVRYSVALLFVLLSSTTPVTAQERLALLNDCSRALSRQDGSPRAVQTCREAVAAVLQAARELGFELRQLEFPASQRRRGEKPVPVNIRIDPRLKEAAEKAAKEDARSLTSLIEKLLQEHLKGKGYLRMSAA